MTTYDRLKMKAFDELDNCLQQLLDRGTKVTDGIFEMVAYIYTPTQWADINAVIHDNLD